MTPASPAPQVANARVFLVGAGALGCEYMKQFALACVGCGAEGSRGLVSVTDMVRACGDAALSPPPLAALPVAAAAAAAPPRLLSAKTASTVPPPLRPRAPPQDRIEASNLSRQFLFRGADVDKFKSERVCTAAVAANPSLHARAYEAAVGRDTELAPFDDAFWREQVRVGVHGRGSGAARLLPNLVRLTLRACRTSW